jgi:hypothetical protein
MAAGEPLAFRSCGKWLWARRTDGVAEPYLYARAALASHPRRFSNQAVTFGHNNLKGNSLTVSRFGYVIAEAGRDHRLGAGEAR